MSSSTPRRILKAVIICFACVCSLFYIGLRFISQRTDPNNEWNLPPDHPYLPFLWKNSSVRVSKEARSFMVNTRSVAVLKRYNIVFLDTLMEFDRLWRRKHNLSYLLVGGTIIGSYRHGGMIPFDDDIDIAIDAKDEFKFAEVFNGSRLAFTPTDRRIRKVFFTHSGTRTNKQGHWPMIDVFFFELRKDGREFVLRKENGIYPTRLVLPTISMPYMGHLFPAPRCPKRFAQLAANKWVMDNCCAYGHNHRLEEKTWSGCIACTRLQNYFQFAKWRRLNATHSQQFLSEPPALDGKTHRLMWRKGFTVEMPNCEE